jgi:NAD-dependent deacetylase
MKAALDKAADLLRSARHAVAFTGAGISTPSGIPDFRSQGSGLWERFNPMEVASLRIFQTHPERFYDWLRPLLQGIWAAQPNPAHMAIAQLEAAGILKALITQNIDDLHQRAGTKTIYEVHGSLRSMTCAHCQKTYPSQQFQTALAGEIPEEPTAPPVRTPAGGTAPGGLPYCPVCKRVLKPDITLFGEMLPIDTWQQAEAHCQQADVILVVGSSLEVWPAAALPELAVENGARLIINNLSTTHLDSSADVLLPGDVAEVLPELLKRLEQGPEGRLRAA